MNRYIDADVLIAHMQEHFEELHKKYGSYDHFVNGYADGIYAVENAPTFKVDTVLSAKKITREEELRYKDADFKEHIKKTIAIELAHYLLEKGYIHFDEDRDKDVITICGLINVLGAKMDGERREG